MIARLMGLRTVSPAELQTLLRQGGVCIVDVNPPASWRAAHVPGARHLDPQSWGEVDLPADKAAPLVFYCSNPLCRKAPNAARRARAMGFADVRVLSAGIRGWLERGLPTEAG